MLGYFVLGEFSMFGDFFVLGELELVVGYLVLRDFMF